MRGIVETAVMTTALVLATTWSTGPVAARMIDGLAMSGARAGVDQTRLPIGDGKLSREPATGSLWSCQERFNGSGAFAAGPWMRADGTYDATIKATVDGDVRWPHQLTIERTGATRTISGNGLPDHPTGVYPVARSDDAYQYDRNPNTIAAQTVQLTLPATPAVAGQPSCVPGGPIGVLLTGSVLFNAVDAAGRDAVAHEVQDQCGGHPERTGSYHYHSMLPCLDREAASGHSPLMGYAFDGFGIYGYRGASGEELSNSDLDACHGHTHTIEWDGQAVEMFHHHATREYPYTIGCYRGQAARVQPGGGPGTGGPGAGNPGSGGPGQNGPGQNGPGQNGPGQNGPGAGGPPAGPPPGGPGGPPPGGPSQWRPAGPPPR